MVVALGNSDALHMTKSIVENLVWSAVLSILFLMMLVSLVRKKKQRIETEKWMEEHKDNIINFTDETGEHKV